MEIYNTLTNQTETFKPIEAGKVSMYVCGPTVYGYIHIGNARPAVFFDTVRRFFEYKDFEVTYVSNFTDVDDKIIAKAKETDTPEMELANHYIDAYLRDIESLGCDTSYIKPRVTEYMPHIIEYINDLIESGHAYVAGGDVYFRVNSVETYGQLSNRNIDDLKSGSRIEINDAKEDPLDFTLWKKTEEGIHWDAPFSVGRPGWHTECVAMIDDVFGRKIDIHGGGSDLIFPHHENEIAHAMAKHGHTVANLWMHNGRLNIEGEKMSKSKGNMVLVKDLPGERMPFRLLLLSSHYRAPINFSDDALDAFNTEWERIENAYRKLKFKILLEGEMLQLSESSDEEANTYLDDFEDALANDFNTPNAITALQGIVKHTNQMLRRKDANDVWNAILVVFETMLDVLGLKIPPVELKDEDKKLYASWKEARKNEDYEKADAIRVQLMEKGILG